MYQQQMVSISTVFVLVVIMNMLLVILYMTKLFEWESFVVCINFCSVVNL